ncbi:MAG: condensation domain-containing protein, partial [Acidobacteria bacterium]|nr:condensation domain-containing protein [Acidobacteriota bacterium]
MSDRLKHLEELSPKKRKLYELLLKEKNRRDTPAKVSVRRAEADSYPLSFAQERLWFIHQLESRSSAYNVFYARRLRGRLNIAALEQSLSEIVRRHEALRTVFVEKDGQPAQVITPPQPLPLARADLSAFTGDEQEAEVERLAKEEFCRPFDLEHAPLIRATLLRLDEDEHVVLLTMHHIISDGWSLGVFSRELMTLYQAFSGGNPSPLPELPIQYADFAVWQKEWLKGEVLEKQMAYWREQLGGNPPVLELPADRPRPAIHSFRGARQTVVLPMGLTASLKELSRQEEATLFMTLLAAFKTLLHRYTGQTDVLVGSPIAGRNRAEIEPLIGFFVNTLALRTDLSGNPTFRELLGRVRKVALDAYGNQDVPFEKLVEELQPERKLSYQPMFHIIFALQNTPQETIEAAGLTLHPQKSENETAKFDLILDMAEVEGGMRATVEYSTDLFDHPTIARLLQHFHTLLAGIAAD